MLKLMKHEFRKTLSSKIVFLVILAILEVIFFIGLRSEDVRLAFNSATIYSGFAVFACFFIFIAYMAFESALGFVKELRTKKSYMYFMTDKSAYTIIGSKIITSIIWIVGFGFLIFGLNYLNASAVSNSSLSAEAIVDMINSILRNFRLPIMEFTNLYVVFLYLLLNCVFFFIVAYFAISLSSTILINNRANAFVSFIIFIAIMIIYFNILNKVILPKDPMYTQHLLTMGDWVRNLIFTGIVGVGIYLISGRLFEKKLNL